MMQSAGRNRAVPDTRSQRTAILRKKLAYVRGNNHSGRTSRFNELMATGSKAYENHSFDSVAGLPNWVLLDAETQDLIGVCAAILNERGAIDRELSGERLSAISAVVGDVLFEDLCDVLLPPQASMKHDMNSTQRLSRPEDFEVIGHELRIKALQSVSVQSETENYPRILCDIAAYVVLGRHTDHTQRQGFQAVGGI